MSEWITREPTKEEQEIIIDIGCALCVSGRYHGSIYEHGIIVSEDHSYEEGKWWIRGNGNTGLTVHGWCIPPDWPEEVEEDG